MRTTIKSLLMFICALTGAAVLGQDVSEQRYQEGLKIAGAVIKANPQALRPDVLSKTRQLLAEQFPALGKTPAVPVITEMDSLRDYDRRFAELLEARHPVLTEAQLERKAAEKYPLYKRGDQVTVYYVRGTQIETWKGRIVAIDDDRVVVGSRKISFNSMEPVEGNDVELLKYQPDENRQARNRYIAQLKQENNAARQDFRLNQHKNVEKELLAQDARRNEENGYTRYRQQWLTPDAFAELVVEAALASQEDARFAALNDRLKDRRALLDNQQQSIDLRLTRELPGRLETPDSIRSQQLEEKRHRDQLARAEQARRQELERLRAEKQAKQQAALAAEEAKKAAAEAARLAKIKAAEEAKAAAEAKAAEEAALAAAEEAAAAEARAKAAEEKRRREMEEEAAAQAPKTIAGLPLPAVVGGGAAIILIAIIVTIILYMRQKKAKDNDPFSKFFEGKGKLQKDFWDQAAADPEHFKYVAYMFPSIEEANKALAHLSYMKPGPGGDLRCSRQLNYGVYPHLNGAVCFVGGVKFSYALWREASAVLPELTNAQYFKVSTEPIVQLDIPDLDKLSQDKHVHIESLGTEDVAGDNGEFIRLYKYRADSRQQAEDFLENFNIHEVGILVHVETPDGILGKDENGVFTLEDSVLENN